MSAVAINDLPIGWRDSLDPPVARTGIREMTEEEVKEVDGAFLPAAKVAFHAGGALVGGIAGGLGAFSAGGSLGQIGEAALGGAVGGAISPGRAITKAGAAAIGAGAHVITDIRQGRNHFNGGYR